jgi:hypothetical protein
MYTLPKKITGYGATQIGVDTFKSLCYSLQTLGAISIKEIRGYEYPKNYYCAIVSDEESEFCLYMNCFHPVIGFGNITDVSEEYFSKPKLTKAIESLGSKYSVLSPIELTAEVTSKAMVNLDKIESKAINRWLPCSTGRVLFSWFFD